MTTHGNADSSIYSLYAVTDRTWTSKKTLKEQLEEALKGGVTLVQLREKELSTEKFLEEAMEIKSLCDSYGVPLIINDNAEIALKTDAAGIHIGQEDMGVLKARELLGPDKIIGVSARTVAQAKKAEKEGADYLGAGAVFGTNTKKDAKNMSTELLREICAAVSIPVVAIGGVTEENISALKDTGIAGVAVVSAIFAKEDIFQAAEELREKVERIV